ncbi:uncharacterized protein BP5553_06117 [Venustampulla echinocandica]|uniref:Myb-like domain-containing protein n=1 Tax=Venustampulla echinocandica TaxID=2656787 RepID=A0A370TMM3_9HELO|nr:uncharacterized protein BP5553_06117 [Venustampulla echinocandica]RDL36765.1 hypothetical protein BP5553_06117 [Venustampulla echinocandica]
MLLPSPLPCDSSSSSSPRLNNLYSTCRSLQSILAPSPFPTPLPSPPTSHTDIPTPLSPSPFKLRLRARKPDTNDIASPALTPRKKITKRGNAQVKAAPPRGINKRRREVDDDMDRASMLRQTPEQEEPTDEQSNDEWEEPNNENEDEGSGPRTPKRMRLAPEVLPLGLERQDFHTLHLLEQLRDTDEVPENENPEEANEEWSTEEDRMLVELVLEKLKLTKSDWQDCARSLGKDRGNVGRRWKSLMGAGEIGLKHRPMRRAKLHGTWR